MATFYADSAGSQGTGDGSSAANACTLYEFWTNDAVLYQSVVAGDVCYCKNGTEIVWDGSGGAWPSPSVAGTSTAPLRVVGYTSTITDNGIVYIKDSSGGSGVFNCDQNYFHLYNFYFTDIRRLYMGAVFGCLHYNVTVDNAADVASWYMTNNSGDPTSFIGCISVNSQAKGWFTRGRATRFINCKALDSSGDGFNQVNTDYGGIFVGCIAAGNGGRGYNLVSASEMVNCVSDDNTSDGVYVDADRFFTLINCAITNNGGYGINGPANSFVLLLNVGTYLNTSGKISSNVTELKDDNPVTIDPKYTDQANQDYTLQDDSPYTDAGYGYDG